MSCVYICPKQNFFLQNKPKITSKSLTKSPLVFTMITKACNKFYNGVFGLIWGVEMERRVQNFCVVCRSKMCAYKVGEVFKINGIVVVWLVPKSPRSRETISSFIYSKINLGQSYYYLVHLFNMLCTPLGLFKLI